MYEFNVGRVTITHQNIPLEIIFFCSLHKQQEYFNVIQNSARNGDETKTVFSEPSRGGYVIADD